MAMCGECDCNSSSDTIPGAHRNRANAIGLGGQHVVGMIADQRDGALAADPSLLAGAPDGNPHQPGTVARQFREGAETEIRPESRAFHLSPADAREIAGDQSDHDAARGQAPQQASDAGADFFRNVRHAANVDRLRTRYHFRHHTLDRGPRHARASAS